jgi:hypothetical protein
MQVAQHASQLPQLTSHWALLQLETAAELVEAAAAGGSIPPERSLEAAAVLCNRVTHWLSETDPMMSDQRFNRPRAVGIYGTCMRRVAGAAEAAAGKLAAAGGPWKQEAACQLLTTTMQLCAWLMAPIAAEHAPSATYTHQHVAALLSDGGPVASALPAASAAQRCEIAAVSWAMQHCGPDNLPAIALAARALRMLCGGSGGSGAGSGGSTGSSNSSGELGPLSAGSLQTKLGKQRLAAEVSCTGASCWQLHFLVKGPAIGDQSN